MHSAGRGSSCGWSQKDRGVVVGRSHNRSEVVGRIWKDRGEVVRWRQKDRGVVVGQGDSRSLNEWW